MDTVTMSYEELDRVSVIERLIGKCLHVGVLESVELSSLKSGTAQGSVLSPLL